VQFMQRARLYGEAVRILDEVLGEHVRDRVVDEFTRIAGPRQQRTLQDPGRMMAEAALQAGLSADVVNALQVLYLARTKQLQHMPNWTQETNEAVWEQLRLWHAHNELKNIQKYRRKKK